MGNGGAATRIPAAARNAVELAFSWLGFWYVAAGLLVPVLPGFYAVRAPPVAGFLLAIVFVYQSCSLGRFFRFLLVSLVAAFVLYLPIVLTGFLFDAFPELGHFSPPFALAVPVNATACVVAYYVVYVANKADRDARGR